jgi:hypothetical protein
MTNKKFFIGMAVLLSVSLFVTGCPTDAADGVQGQEGQRGPIYLSGEQTTAGINHAIASNAPLVFAGVIQSDTGVVIIPSGRNVTLVGDAAYTTEATAEGILIIGDASSVTGDGKVVADTAGIVIAPAGLEPKVTGSMVPVQDGSNTVIDLAAGDVAAVKKGDITIDGEATTATNINASDLGTKTLFVFGNVTVSEALGAATIYVRGNAVVDTADQTAAVVWNITGDLDAQKLPTKAAGTLSVGGKADFAEAVADITGDVKIGGKATFADTLNTGTGAVSIGGDAVFEGALTVGTGALKIGGKAAFPGETLTVGAGGISIGGDAEFADAAVTFAGTGATRIAGKTAFTKALTTAGQLSVRGTFSVTGKATLGGNLTVGGTADFQGELVNTAESVATFNGVTTITGKVTPDSNSLAIAGTGAVTLAAAPDLTNGLTIKNTAGVTLVEATTIAANIVATNVTIKGDATTGTVLKTGNIDLTVAEDNRITVTGETAKIVAGGSSNKVTITGAVLKAGAYTGTDGKLSLGDTTEIEVNGGQIVIAGSGELELTEVTSKVVLNANSALDVLSVSGKFGEATQEETKITVAAADVPATPTKAGVVKAPALAEWTVTTDGSTGVDISDAESKIILGTFAVDFDGTSAVNADECVAATADSKTAAAGKLVAGAGTIITFTGST